MYVLFIFVLDVHVCIYATYMYVYTQMKVIKPPMLEGENILADCVRTFLLPDGRDDNILLPAEGYFFVTSYRYDNHIDHVISE